MKDNKNDMQQNLYRILRMNIILAKSNGELITDDTLQNFEDTAKKIDEYENDLYDKNINTLFYKTATLEDEVSRLEKIINLITNRINKRQELMNDYKDTTNVVLMDLDYIKEEDKVLEYEGRLSSIKRYLANKEEIKQIEDKLNALRLDLDKCYNDKQLSEEHNYELEDNLLLTFKKIISKSIYSDVLNAIDVDFELEKIKPDVIESKKTLDTFDVAFNNLKKGGISLDSELEYASYVDEAKKSYYFIKEKEYLYNIYKNIVDSKNIYSELNNKRDNLNKIIEERLLLREKIGITDEDILNNLYDLLDKQNKNIISQKQNIDNIGEIEDLIKVKERKLNELKKDNEEVDILSILQEYGIIDTYNTDVIEKKILEETKEPLNEEKHEEIKVESRLDEKEEFKLPNTIVEVKDLYDGLNISFVRSKADTVMRRVGKSLGYTPEVKKEITDIVSKKEEPIEKINLNSKDDELEKMLVPDDSLNLLASMPDIKPGSNNNVSNLDFPSSGPEIPKVEPIKENTNSADEIDDFWSTMEKNSLFPDKKDIEEPDNNIQIPKLDLDETLQLEKGDLSEN